MNKKAPKIQLPPVVSNLRSSFSSYQKLFFVYFVVLLLLFLFLPLVKINAIGSTKIETFGLFSQYMTKSAIIISLIILFLLAYNSSKKRRYKFHTIFGFAHNSYLSNIWWLLIILVALFSIGDTITLLKQNMTPGIATSSGFLIIGIYVIIGLILSIMIARIEHKRSTKSTEVNVKSETDDSKLEPRFEQAHKEVEGLFGEETW